MTYPQRAIRVGGYFTSGMLIINSLFANIGTVPGIVVSVVTGLLFTVASLYVGKRYKLH